MRARPRPPGLAAMALTDHDTVAGVPAAIAAGERARRPGGGRLRVQLGRALGRDARARLLPAVALGRAGGLPRALPRRPRAPGPRDGDAGCSGSGVDARLRRRAAGSRRAARWAGRTWRAPSSARAGPSTSHEAFDRYIGRGRPAFVDKVLPSFPRDRGPGALGARAWSRSRTSRSGAPARSSSGSSARGSTRSRPATRATIPSCARGSPTSRSGSGLLRTGGSDWHGDPEPGETHGALGSQEVPLEWLERLEELRAGSAGAGGLVTRLLAAGRRGARISPPSASDGRIYALGGAAGRAAASCWRSIPGNDTPG